MDNDELAVLAKKLRNGYVAGKLTNAKMGITHAENQSIRRRMQKQNYKGTIPFYIASLCLNVIRPLIRQKERALFFEKMRLDDMKQRVKISEVLECDILEIPDFIKNGECSESIERKLQNIDENVFFCATIAMTVEMGAMDKLDRHTLYKMFEHAR